MVTENILTPNGIQSKGDILNINNGRRRISYYDPKDGSWTSLLPADPYSVAYYRAKGFLLPNEVEKSQVATAPKPVIEVTVITDTKSDMLCPMCQRVCKGAFGLRLHLKKHLDDTKKEVKK